MALTLNTQDTESTLAASPIVHLCTEVTRHDELRSTITRSHQTQIKLAAQQSLLQINFHRTAWNRCIKETMEGKFDGLYALFWTPERAQFLAFPKGAESDTNTVRLRQASFYFFENVERPLDINNLRFGIGAPLGYVAYDYLREQNLLSPIDYDLEEGMKMLGQQKLDAYLVGEQLGNQVIQSLGLDEQIQKRMPAFLIKDLHVAFNQASYNRFESKIEAFWAQLEELRATAKY